MKMLAHCFFAGPAWITVVYTVLSAFTDRPPTIGSTHFYAGCCALMVVGIGIRTFYVGDK